MQGVEITHGQFYVREHAKDLRPSMPLLMLHGSEDPIADPAGAREFFDGLAGRDARSAIVFYPGAKHSLLMEPCARDAALAAVADFVSGI